MDLEQLLQKAQECVSEARLMDDTVVLSQWEKLAGSDGETAAFDYIEGRMKQAGFQTERISHDAYISLPVEAELETLGRTIKCITHSFGLSASASGLTGEVVWCGKGSVAELAEANVRGKIALIEGLATPWASKLASEFGALGQIHITPDGKIHEMCVSPVWGNPSIDDLDALPKTVIVTVSRDDGFALLEAAQIEEVRATIKATVDTGWRKTPILVADLVPDHLADDAPFVMFSGHVDTWYLGVMDNGTANATMLEVARALSSVKSSMQRAVRLCFWSGHSQGRYSSSAWYADQKFVELDTRCVAHVNIDSTGGIGATDLTGAGSDLPFRKLAAEAVERVSGQTIKGRKIGRAGDESFWGIGIPALFGAISHQETGDGVDKFVLPLGWWWHTPEDTIDKIDPGLLVRDTKVFVGGVLSLILSERLPLDLPGTLKALGQEIESIYIEKPYLGTDELEKLTNRLADDLASKLRDLSPPDANELLRTLSRILTPLECTRVDRFNHDPALPISHWPALDPLRALHAAEPGSDTARFAEVGAVRAANRVRYALVEIQTAIKAATDKENL